MIVCPKCGKQLADGAKFCKFCGSATIQPQPQAIAQNNVQIPAPQTPKKKKSSKTIILAIIAVILVIAIGVGGWLLWDVIAEKKKEDLTDEEKLTQLLEESTTKPIIEFVYDDYDSDGTCEAYAVVGETDEEDEKHPEFYDADIYFVNHKKAQPIKENISGQVNGTIDVEDNKYISIEVYEDGTDEGKSFIYTADGTKSDEADISGKYSNVHEKDGRIVGFDDNGKEIEIDFEEKEEITTEFFEDIDEEVIVLPEEINPDIIKEVRNASVGDIVEFGSYPQTRVTDSVLLDELNSQDFNWISYNYYSGTGDYGTMMPGNWMKYADVVYNGNRYRVVTFSQYRPYSTTDETKSEYSYQDENGYDLYEIYWFKYEPVKWRVLDPDEGFIVCEDIIDSQSFNDTMYTNYGDYYNDDAFINYSNNYQTSSIKIWLNNNFYSTAFTSKEQLHIKNVDVTEYGSSGDKVFLLSYQEITNPEYGFSTSEQDDANREWQGTDYAKCQGLWVYDVGYNAGNSWWWTCSTNYHQVYLGGYDISYNDACLSGLGVVPALKINV